MMRQAATALMALVLVTACDSGTQPAVDSGAGDGRRDAGVDAGPPLDVGPSMEAGGSPDKGAPALDAGAHDAAAPLDVGSTADAKKPDAGAGAADAQWSDLGADTTAAVDATAAPLCLPKGYAAYFAGRPLVLAATVGRLNAAGQAYLCKDLNELETKGSVTIAEPAASAGCIEPTSCTYITPTADERNQILAAKYAHAIWLDRNAKVSWSLAKFTPAALDGLFDPKVIFRNGTHFMSVVDHSPTQAWAYLSGRKLVGADMKSSMIAVLDDLRTTDTKLEFVHGIATGTNPDPVNTAYTLDEALQTRVTKAGGVSVRVARKGCHSMSRILLALLRAMNIPGQEVHAGQWYDTGHSTPHWPTLGLVMPHADDVYQATLRATPTSGLLAPVSFYSDPVHTAVCGANKGCLGRRYASLNVVAYPAQYTTKRCCNPTTYGYASCSAYLTANHATTLTSAEIAAAAVSIGAGCPP